MALNSNPSTTKKRIKVQRQWLKPVILATRKVEIQRIRVRGQPGQKFQDPISTNCWAWCHMSVILAIWGSTNRRTMVQTRHKAKYYLENDQHGKG
jgi:hypothetical protein